MSDASIIATGGILLHQIFVYPIKSGPAMEAAHKWLLDGNGLWLDRRWMLLDANGVPLKANKRPAMMSISYSVVWQFYLIVRSDRNPKPLMVCLDQDQAGEPMEYQICSRSRFGYDCGPQAKQWWSETLATDNVRMVRAHEEHSMNNKAQYLLLNLQTVRALLHFIGSSDDKLQMDERELCARFRPNLVVDGAVAFEEETWQRLTIGHVQFRCVGKCQRCSVIAHDSKGGQSTPQLINLLKAFRGDGEFTFGIYLEREDDESNAGHIGKGDPVQPSSST